MEKSHFTWTNFWGAGHAAKVVGVLFALGLVSIAGVYGWDKYDARRAENAHQEQVKTCSASITESAIVFVRTGDEVTNVVKSFCEANPGKNIACGLKTDNAGSVVPYDLGDTDKSNPGKVCTAKGWKSE